MHEVKPMESGCVCDLVPELTALTSMGVQPWGMQILVP